MQTQSEVFNLNYKPYSCAFSVYEVAKCLKYEGSRKQIMAVECFEGFSLEVELVNVTFLNFHVFFFRWNINY
jgi:hypothetical protein